MVSVVGGEKTNIRNKLFLTGLVSLSLILAMFSGYVQGFSTGLQEGYQRGLIDVADLASIDFRWSRTENGSYLLEVYSGINLLERFAPRVDLVVVHRRNGEVLDVQRHAGVLTNIGKDWVEDQLSDSPSATTIAKYVSCSADTAAGMSAASTELTNELAANGFTRAAGTYASTGVGAWTVTKEFTSSGTQTVQLYGLQWDTTAESDNNLLCYDTSSAKNTVSGDTLEVTWTLSVT